MAGNTGVGKEIPPTPNANGLIRTLFLLLAIIGALWSMQRPVNQKMDFIANNVEELRKERVISEKEHAIAHTEFSEEISATKVQFKEVLTRINALTQRVDRVEEWADRHREECPKETARLQEQVKYIKEQLHLLELKLEATRTGTQ
jgi:multidrug resistance efflux pump